MLRHYGGTVTRTYHEEESDCRQAYNGRCLHDWDWSIPWAENPNPTLAFLSTTSRLSARAAGLEHTYSEGFAHIGLRQ